jgi:ADP-ribosyl-[dinitrogen reductase] hydrolase
VRDGLGHLAPSRRGWWGDRLDEAERWPPGSFRPNGFVVTALQAAYAAVRQTPTPAGQPCRHLQDALAVAVQIGDDTDTVAAIAGALLGARWGASAVPLAWRELIHGWPGYQVADLVRLGILGARGGEPDPSGWPDAPSLQGYYAARFSPSGVYRVLAADDGVAIGDVAALKRPPAGTDVVVSLCRVGRHDVPEGVEGCQLWLVDESEQARNPNLDFLIADTARQVACWRERGRRVFIHCVMAESRTPTVAAAYLAERFGISGQEALASVAAVLPNSHPNPGFVAALDRLWPPGRGRP